MKISPQHRLFLMDVVTLIKPRITSLTVITALAGMSLAPGSKSLKLTIVTLLGTALLVGGANALNMFLERDTDLLMERTQDRPLPGKRMTPDFVLGFGALLIGLAIPILIYWVNPLTGALGALSLASYVLFYTPMKRKTSYALLIGAVPGAMPPLLGWTAVTNSIAWPGLILFAIIFLWQVPHFLAIAIFRKEEYARAGIKVMTLEKNTREIHWQIFLYTLALVPISLLLVPLKAAGWIYLSVALILGMVFLIYAGMGFKIKALETWSRRLFFISLVYLTVLFGTLFVDGQGGPW